MLKFGGYYRTHSSTHSTHDNTLFGLMAILKACVHGNGVEVSESKAEMAGIFLDTSISYWRQLVLKYEVCTILNANELKFMLSKKDTKIDEIFTVDLTLCSM